MVSSHTQQAAGIQVSSSRLVNKGTLSLDRGRPAGRASDSKLQLAESRPVHFIQAAAVHTEIWETPKSLNERTVIMYHLIGVVLEFQTGRRRLHAIIN